MSEQNKSIDVFISVSEVQQFLRCRRMWDFVSHNRQSLVRSGLPTLSLHSGTLVHSALHAHAQGGDPIATLKLKAAEAEAKAVAEYQKVVGASPASEELTNLNDARELCMSVVRNYFAHWGDKPVAPLEYLKTEIAFRVPVDVNIPGKNVFLIGTFDGIARSASGKRLWIVDHKTFTRRTDARYLIRNFQFVAYVWAAKSLFGDQVAGLLYDGVWMKQPVIPEVLKSGALSKKAIDTTPAVYLACLQELGLNPADYGEFISELTRKQLDPASSFFVRHEFMYSDGGLRTFEREVTAALRDMVNSPSIYANFRWEGCWDCQITDLCDAVQLEEDVDFLIKHKYKRDTYDTVKAVKALQPTQAKEFLDEHAGKGVATNTASA